MNKPDKETLAILRKAAGHGYCPKVVDLLREEHNYTVEKNQQVYDVVHGKTHDDTIMKAFLTYVTRKSEANAAMRQLIHKTLETIQAVA